MQQQGDIRYIGASVYTEEEAIVVIEAGCFQILQVAYNILDQRMARQVFPAAEEAGVGIIVRSAFLKGALTEKAQWLPIELAELKMGVVRAMRVLDISWQALPEFALRFCLSAPEVSTVLVGARTIPELEQALAAEVAGPLPEELLVKTKSLGLTDERLLNPTYWNIN